ncbi:uncharacterized protein TNCV_622941 [Trichonephila clavipes]|nr:uncharacterized protein TNCV_622941 [Trichonephila clavipes]
MSKNVVVVSFPKGGNKRCQSLRQVGLLYDRWRHHLSPASQFRQGTGGEGNILQPPALLVSAVTAHMTFGPTEMSSYSVCTWKVFGGIGHRTQAFWSPML